MLENPSATQQETTLTKIPGENSLLLSVMPILSILVLLRNSAPEDNIQSVNALLIRCINTFEQTSQRKGFSIRDILAVKYCLCTVIDEAILSTSWGQKGSWDEMNLLATFYKESFGGERFYIILNTMLEDPQKNREILEILYILLSLGFKGKNFNKDPFFQKALRKEIFNKIEPYINTYPNYLLSPEKYRLPQRSTSQSLWIFTAFITLFFIGTSLIVDCYVFHLSKPVFKTLQHINNSIKNQSRKTQ